VILVLSSVQVLTTNPLFESWGHFPEEKLRLLRLVNQYSKLRKERNEKDSFALVFLSGDVHHGEILDASSLSSPSHPSKDGRIMEITSSGMTHSLSNSFYGTIVAPALEIFSSHRHKNTSSRNNVNSSSSSSSYYLNRNFGSIQIHWSSLSESELEFHIHNHEGQVVLSSSERHPLSFYSFNMTDKELYDIAYSCLNGHVLKRIMQGFYPSVLGLWIILGSLLWNRRRRRLGYKMKNS
jgi:alkaline phosphatase D